MSDILIKNVPSALHKRLKREAAENRRSMNNHILTVLEQLVERDAVPRRLPKAVKPRKPLGEQTVTKAIRSGRA